MTPRQPEPDAEDENFWAEITRNITKTIQPEEPPAKPLIMLEIKPTVDLTAVYSGETLTDLQNGNTDNIDNQTAKRFKRSEFPVEATLDLHGKTEDQAFAAVDEFIRRAWLGGKRCVIIITGKGYHQEDSDYFNPKGKLKERVPLWLNRRELRPLILAYKHPEAKLGGSGALYILLRRKR